MILDLRHISALKYYLLIWWSLLLLRYKILQPDVKGFTLILDVSLEYTWETYTVCWPWKNCLVCLCLWSNFNSLVMVLTMLSRVVMMSINLKLFDYYKFYNLNIYQRIGIGCKRLQKKKLHIFNFFFYFILGLIL